MVSFITSKANFLSINLCLLFLLVLVGNSQAQSDWKKEWKRTLKAAEEEGTVTAYVAAGNWKFLDEFQKAYPKIKLKKIEAPRGNILLHRVMAERRAGKYLADVYITGITTHLVLYKSKVLDPMHPAFILPEVKDQSKWFKGKHSWFDPENRYSFRFEGYRSNWLYYNTNLVSSNEVRKIKSWWDLINPKWKGKIAAYTPLIPGHGSRILWFFYKKPSLGREFMKKFYIGMDVSLSRDHRLLIDWLATGKVSWCIPCSADRVRKAKEQGLPVSWATHSLKEGDSLQGGIGTVSLLNKGPHPNARKVFINWLFSRKGQIAFQNVSIEIGRPTSSLRTDIPKNRVPPYYLPREGIPLLIDDWNFSQEVTEVRKILKEILATR